MNIIINVSIIVIILYYICLLLYIISIIYIYIIIVFWHIYIYMAALVPIQLHQDEFFPDGSAPKIWASIVKHVLVDDFGRIPVLGHTYLILYVYNGQ